MYLLWMIYLLFRFVMKSFCWYTEAESGILFQKTDEIRETLQELEGLSDDINSHEKKLQRLLDKVTIASDG